MTPLELTEEQRSYLAILGLLEVLDRFGEVKRPRGQVIPFPVRKSNT